MYNFLNIFLLVLLLTACVSTNSYKEYALAQSSLLTAKKFEANKLAPKMYLKAQKFYKKGISLYKKKNYEKAQSLFEKSILFSEKAEWKARVKTLRELE